MNFVAHPTNFAGTLFRSRLEARWAAFFDLIAWQWTYEPFDLHGWVPDFALRGLKQTVLVEVKPVFEFPKDIANKIDKTYPASEGEALILGCEFANNGNDLGWLRDEGYWELTSWTSIPGMPKVWSKFGFCHSCNSFRCRISGCHDGDSYVLGTIDREIVRFWKDAQNAVQWRKS